MELENFKKNLDDYFNNVTKEKFEEDLKRSGFPIIKNQNLLQKIYNKIIIKIQDIFNNHGYYKLNQLQPWGNCGCCGENIREVLPKDWSWGLCEDCKGKKAATV